MSELRLDESGCAHECVFLWVIWSIGGGQGLHLLPPVHPLHLIKAGSELPARQQAPWTLQPVPYLD